MARKRSSKNAASQGLPADKLRPECSPGDLGFTLSSELETVGELAGQYRVLDAITFGTGIRRRGYNLFVLAPEVSAGRAAVIDFVAHQQHDGKPPDDWIYVHNFQTEWQPQAMRLPSGWAHTFSEALAAMVDDLRGAIPALFESEEYKDRLRKIDEEHAELEEKAFEQLRTRADSQSIGILRTPVGFALAPLREGNVVKPEEFNALPEKEREVIQERIEVLQRELADVLHSLPELEKKHRDKARALNAELAATLVDRSISAVGQAFTDIAAARERLEAIRLDLVKNFELFLVDSKDREASPFPVAAVPVESDTRFRRYLTNIMVAKGVDEDSAGFPIVYEDHPTLSRLVGHIEHISQMGTLLTDFSMIRSGALHRANGGYLVLDARKLLSEPWAWDALKRALRSGRISITSSAEELGLAATTLLEPEPVDLDVKVILIGERVLYYLLAEYDPDFVELFKVQVDFDDEFERSNANIALYARLIATIGRREKLKPLDAAATAAIIDESSRMAADAQRLSLEVGRLMELLGQADHWAGIAGREHIGGDDVAKSIAEQSRRASRVNEHFQQAVARNILLIDTDGEKVGQVNGLSVVQLGSSAFGRPSRITARVRVGSGEIIDIEREAKLGGPLHSKGVLILSSYLAANYALSAPMCLWASLVFEQSYGGVDGDSASSAELYALLSALSDTPILQSFAVTGSVNQLGEVQAIGGVNEKIEGFFDICDARGLTGRQGVLIPQANQVHLVLRPRVVDAVRGGQFQIYAIASIQEGIERLTGLPAGERGDDDKYPKGSINAKVEACLQSFAETRRSYGAKKGERDDGAA